MTVNQALSPLVAINWVFGIIVIVLVSALLMMTRTVPITPGQTVTDPGVSIGHSTYFGDIAILGSEESAAPVNWHEIPESERPTTHRLTDARLKRVFLNYCHRQTGAKIAALEQFEDEVLVKYSNSARKKDSDNCPTGVVFWMSAKDFLKANSQYQEVMEIKTEQEEANRKAKNKEQRKLEVVRRHVSPPPETPSPA